MKKAFTLFELLVVIIILAVVLVVAIPKVLKAINESREKTFKLNEELIVNTIEHYLADITFKLPKDTNDSLFVSLNELKEKKLIKDIVDPKDKTVCDMNSSGVVITRLDSENYDYTPYLKCSNYTSEFVNKVISVSQVNNGTNTNATITINLDSTVREVKTPTSTIGIVRPSILDYTTWVSGTTGSQTGFTANGTAAESQIVLKINPWGETDVVWATLTNDIDSGGDGGWNSSQFNIDATKKYRYSVWVRRENVGTGSGTTYFGTNGFNSSGSNIGVARLSDSTANTNYYFGSAGYTSWPQIVDNWLLMVAYVHPQSYSSTSSDSTTGIYNTSGVKLYTLNDCKWLLGNTKTYHRAYLYYSTKIDEGQYFYRPRVDIVDGSEPTITELIMGAENPSINNYSIVNKTGTVSYVVTANGVYDFVLKIKDGSVYKFTYSVTGIN